MSFCFLPKISYLYPMTTHKHWVADILRSWATTFDIRYGVYKSNEEAEEDKVNAEAYDYINLLADKLLNDTCTIDDYENILFHLYQKFEGIIGVPQLHPYPKWDDNRVCHIRPHTKKKSEHIKLHFWLKASYVRDEILKK